MKNTIYAPLDSYEGANDTGNLWFTYDDTRGSDCFATEEADRRNYVCTTTRSAFLAKLQQLVYSDPRFMGGRNKSGVILALDFTAVNKPDCYAADVIGAGSPPDLDHKSMRTKDDAKFYIKRKDLVQKWLKYDSSVDELSDNFDVALCVLDRLIDNLKNKRKFKQDQFKNNAQGTTLLLYDSQHMTKKDSQSDFVSQKALKILKTVLKHLPVGVANQVSFATAARTVDDCRDIDIACTSETCANTLSQNCAIDIAKDKNSDQCVSYFGSWLQQKRFEAALPSDLAKTTTIDELERVAAKLGFVEKWGEPIDRKGCNDLWKSLNLLNNDKEQYAKHIIDKLKAQFALPSKKTWQYKHKPFYRKLVQIEDVAEFSSLDKIEIINLMESAVSIIDDRVVEKFIKLKELFGTRFKSSFSGLFDIFDEYFDKKEHWVVNNNETKEAYEKLKSSLGYECASFENWLNEKLKEGTGNESCTSEIGVVAKTELKAMDFKSIKDALRLERENFFKEFPKNVKQPSLPITQGEKEARKAKARLRSSKVFATMVLFVCAVAGCGITLWATYFSAKIAGLFVGNFNVDYIINKTIVLYGDSKWLYPYSLITTWEELLNWKNWVSAANILYLVFAIILLGFGLARCWQCKPEKANESEGESEYDKSVWGPILLSVLLMLICASLSVVWCVVTVCL